MAGRMQRVDELLKREISQVIQKDFEWSGQLVTVNGVEVTRDLKEAKVWIGVLGGQVDTVLDKIRRKSGFIQNKVMKRVVLRNTPILSFHVDDSAERGVDIVNLLEEVDQIPKAGESADGN